MFRKVLPKMEEEKKMMGFVFTQPREMGFVSYYDGKFVRGGERC